MAIQTKISKFNKLKFLANFTIILIKTFKKFTFFLIFKKIGLIFYNLEIILQKII